MLIQTCETHRMKQTDSRSDDELLLAIANDRDQAAFSILFKRYQHQAFNVSRYLTRDPEAAKEAVQDAMMSIWFNAKFYKPGYAKGWILQIVTRVSLNAVRGKRRKKAFLGRLKTDRVTPLPEPVSEGVEVKEAVGAVREALELLDLGERQLVSLHYGAGLSQRQIAKELSIPQRTVSDRVARLLEKLRKNLAGRGHVAMAPVALAVSISDAVCSGMQAPLNLAGNVVAQLAQAKRGRAAEPFASQTSHKAFMALSLFIALGSAWVFWPVDAHLNPGPSSARLPAAKQIDANQDVRSGLGEFERFSLLDEFNDPKLKSFWIPSKAGSGVRPAGGINESQLILQADAKDGGSLKQSQEVELYSREFELKARGYQFEVDSGQPTGSGSFEYGFVVLKQGGEAIYQQAYKVRSIKGGFRATNLVKLNGKNVLLKKPTRNVGVLFVNSFKGGAQSYQTGDRLSSNRERTIADGHLRYSHGYAIDMATLRFRFYVKAEPGSWIRWPINKFVLNVFPESTDEASKK